MGLRRLENSAVLVRHEINCQHSTELHVHEQRGQTEGGSRKTKHVERLTCKQHSVLHMFKGVCIVLNVHILEGKEGGRCVGSLTLGCDICLLCSKCKHSLHLIMRLGH